MEILPFQGREESFNTQGQPSFLSKLPTSPDAYGDSFKIEPADDFRRANEFYILTDNPELVYIMTNDVPQFFGNFWCPQNAIIFKGLCVLFLFSCSLYLARRVWETQGGGALSSHLSRVHAVGFVSRSRCPPLELPGIIVDCNRLSHSGTHRWSENT